jgi:hypothetical protein
MDVLRHWRYWEVQERHLLVLLELQQLPQVLQQPPLQLPTPLLQPALLLR